MLSRVEGSRISPGRLAKLEVAIQVCNWVATWPGFLLIAWILLTLPFPALRPRGFLESTANGSLVPVGAVVEFALMGPLSLILTSIGYGLLWFGISRLRGVSRRMLVQRTVFVSGKLLPLVAVVAAGFASGTRLGKASVYVPWVWWFIAAFAFLSAAGTSIWVAGKDDQAAKEAAAEVRIRKTLAGRQATVSLPDGATYMLVLPPYYPFGRYSSPNEFAFGWYPALRRHGFSDYKCAEEECQEYLERLESGINESDQPIYVSDAGSPILVHVSSDSLSTEIERLQGKSNSRILSNDVISPGTFERASCVILAEGISPVPSRGSFFGLRRRLAGLNSDADRWRLYIMGESEGLLLVLSMTVNKYYVVEFYQGPLQEMLEAATVERVSD